MSFIILFLEYIILFNLCMQKKKDNPLVSGMFIIFVLVMVVVVVVYRSL